LNTSCTTQKSQIISEKATKRVVKLKNDFLYFLLQRVFQHFLILSVITKTNRLNMFLQDKGDGLVMSEKVFGFQRNLLLWREHF
jgi:hypothetical protein